MNKYILAGPFKEHIQNYLNYKISLGQSIIATRSHLNMFDRYTVSIPPKDNILTKEYIENWLKKNNDESLNSIRVKAWDIRNFCVFLNQQGIKSHIINIKNYNFQTNFIPHIYTNEELKKFFDYIENNIQGTNCFPLKKEMLYLLFKILYCCGLRISEALSIKMENIDLIQNIIVIMDSKNHIDRNIVINDDIKNSIKNYQSNCSYKITYLFENIITNKPISYSNIINEFNIIISNSLNNNEKYRIHDFRHTYAVRCLKKWYLNNNDINVMLPILMTYMGHSHLRSTEYYLKFTSDLFPNFLEQYQQKFDNLFHNLEVDFFEQ